ncbi:hypothetical protein PVAND_001419 [Polypedilum vanderplanki]|uniref:Uncharacterized protein n=1 Tax=Polypedilum vanderplanki TaxID=319348 RepID=A0A9J6BN61_POLVA|nr:hypothetical protein PVAND_001419 [Polypedilum vanderplanki]
MQTRQFSLIILALVSSVVSADDDIEKCKIDDEICLLKNANLVFKKFYKGLDSFKIPSLDPMRIEKLAFNQDLNSVKVDAVISDTDFTGLSTAKISKFTGLHTGNVELKFNMQVGGFAGPYIVKGKLLKLAIEGKGTMKCVLKNMDMTMKFRVTNKTIDGKTYLHGEKPWMTLSIAGGSASLSHLGSIANSFINWSFVVLVNAVKETFSKPFSAVFLEHINQILDNVPVDELFEQ